MNIAIIGVSRGIGLATHSHAPNEKLTASMIITGMQLVRIEHMIYLL